MEKVRDRMQACSRCEVKAHHQTILVHQVKKTGKHTRCRWRLAGDADICCRQKSMISSASNPKVSPREYQMCIHRIGCVWSDIWWAKQINFRETIYLPKPLHSEVMGKNRFDPPDQAVNKFACIFQDLENNISNLFIDQLQCRSRNALMNKPTLTDSLCDK